MAHLWTPQDLPADFKLGWYHFPDSGTVTLDGNGKIASIENKFDNGSRPCATADATKRHLLQKFNGYDTAFSDTTNYGGILMTNTTGLPVGNADLCMVFVQMPQDGVVGGYRGGNNYWVDNPFPDYRMRTNAGDYTLTGNTNNTTLHTLIVNRKSGTSTFRVDGTARGSQTPSGGYNTTLGTFGIKGADAAYYVQKGSSLGAIVGKRAATADEMYLIEKWYSTFTGQTVQADNPYINGLPMVQDGGGTAAAADNASQAQAASAPSLNPRAVIAPTSTAQSQTTTSPTIAARGSTQPDAASQFATATSPTLAPRNASVPDNAAQASTADSPAITPRSAISPDSAVGQQATTSPNLSVSGSVSVAPASQPQATTVPALSARSALSVDSAAQQSQGSSPALSAVRSSVTPSPAAQPMSASQPTIAVAGSVAVTDVGQSQVAMAPTLAARSAVVPASAGQASTVSAPAISTRGSVAANDAQQANSVTAVAVMARFSVTPGSVAQPQVVTAPTLSSRASLLVSSAIQAQALTSPRLVRRHPPVAAVYPHRPIAAHPAHRPLSPPLSLGCMIC